MKSINVLKLIKYKIYTESIRFRDWCIYRLATFQRPKYEKKYNIAICGIFKNEARFLKEWIEYHSLIGVDHFYLYNNNSTDNYKDILKPYIDSGLVSLIDWPYEQGQMTAYHHFYENFWNQAQWISFLDIDEFFVPKTDFNLLEWIKRHDRNPVNLIYWKFFGSSGSLKHDDNRLVIEQYLSSWETMTRCGKCLINTDYNIARFDSGTHHATCIEKRVAGIRLELHPIDIFNHINVFDKESKISKKTSDKSEIQINHYWSKAWEIYNLKRQYTGDVFFKNNPKQNIWYYLSTELYCDSRDYAIQRFLLLLKWKMKGMPEYNEITTTQRNKESV